MSDFEQFKTRVAEKGAEVVRRLDQDGLLAERLARSLGGDKPLTPAPQLSAEEMFWMDIVHFVGEVDYSLAVLKQIPVYLRFFPRYRSWRRKGISKADWLKYHIEHFFEESYICYERVDHFLDWIAEWFKSHGQSSYVAIATSAKKSFARDTKDIRALRGGHVHRRRFKDEIIDWLNLIDIVDKASGGSPFPETTAERVQQLALQYWRGRVRSLTASLRVAVDRVFAELGPLLFPSVEDEPRT